MPKATKLGKGFTSQKKKPTTPWLQNAMKSIGSASGEVFKDMAPNIYEVATSGAKSINDVRKVVRRGSTSSAANVLNNNKFVKMGRDTINNALEDLKSGNFNNTDRETKAIMGGDMDWDSFGDDFGTFMSDDDWGDGEGAVIQQNFVTASNDDLIVTATDNLSKQINVQSENQLKVAKANMDVMVSIGSAQMLQNQEIGNTIISHLGNISNSLEALVAYQNENMTRFIDSSIAYMEARGKKEEEQESASKDTINPYSAWNSNKGGLNVDAYKKLIKQQAEKTFKGSTLGWMSDMIADNADLLAANPLGMMSKMIIGGLVPTVMKETIGGVEEAFSGFVPTMLDKLAQLGDRQGNSLQDILLRSIGKVLGVRQDRLNSFDLRGKITTDEATFDKITRHTIVEVIPKYLREQSAYLEELVDVMGGNSKNAVNRSQVFDFNEGYFKRFDQFTEEIYGTIRDAVINKMDASKFGSGLRNRGNMLKEGEDRNNYDKLLNDFFLALERNGKGIDVTNFNDDSELSKILNSLNGSPATKKILVNALKVSARDATPSLNATVAIQNAINARNAQIRNMEGDPGYYQLNSIASGKDQKIDAVIDQLGLSGAVPSSGNKNRETPVSLLSDIKMMMRTGVNVRIVGMGPAKTTETSTSTVSSSAIEQVKESGSTTSDSGLSEEDINKISDEELQKTMEENDAIFTKTYTSTKDQKIASVGKRIQNAMFAIAYGNSSMAFDEIASIVGDRVVAIGNSFKEKFLDPMKKELFGTKDETGYSRDGLLSATQNKFLDTYRMFAREFSGKGYTDSQGKKIEDKKEGEASVMGNIKNMLKTVQSSMMDYIFGDEKVITNPDGTTKTVRTTAHGALSFVVGSLKQGFEGMNEFIFGKNTDEEKEEIYKSLQEKVSEAIPAAGTGAAIGGLTGILAGSSLLGTLVGGPIGGALIGVAGGIISRSDKFQDWLFGPEDEETHKRIGGFISKDVQNLISENKGAIIGGAAVGAAKTAIFGGNVGLLSSLVGGPIAGALIGGTLGYVKKTQAFQDFLYGSEITDANGNVRKVGGILNAFNGIFKKTEDDVYESAGSKVLGMGVLGAGAGALTAGVVGQMGLLGAMFTPAGPLGGAIAGAVLGIKASNKAFRTWLLGEDEIGPDGKVIGHKNGVLGKLGNALTVEVFEPMRDMFYYFAEDAQDFVIDKILAPVEFAISPLIANIQSMGDFIKGKINDAIDSVKDMVKVNVIDPIVDIVVKPFRSVAGFLLKAVWGISKMMIAQPFNLLSLITGFGDARERRSSRKQVMRENRENESFGDAFLDNMAIRFNIGNARKDAEYKYTDYAEDWDLRKQQYEEDRKARTDEHKRRQEERRVSGANRRLISRWTGRQQLDDTAENRELAQAQYDEYRRSKGARGLLMRRRLDFKGDPIEIAGTNGSGAGESVEDALKQTDPKKMSPVGGILQYVRKIASAITGSDITFGKNEKEKKEESKPESDNSLDTLRSLMDEQEEENASEDQKKLGFLARTRNRITGFGSNVRNRVQGGVSKIRGIAQKFHLPGFASGTDETPEGSMLVGEAGPEIITSPGGESISSLNRTVKVEVVGVTRDAANSMGKGVSDNIEAAPTAGGMDGNHLAQVAALTGASGLTGTAAGMLGGDSDSIIDALSSAKDKEANESALDKVRNAKNLAAQEEAKKEAEKEEREKELLATTKENTESNKEHHSLWSTIFSKKGLITAGLIALAPTLIKAIPTIVSVIGTVKDIVVEKVWPVIQTIGSVVGSIVSSIVGKVQEIWEEVKEKVIDLKDRVVETINNGIDHILHSLGLGEDETKNGESAGERLEENAEELVDMFTTGDVMNWVAPNGVWDHLSDAKSMFLAKIGLKPLSKAIDLTAKGAGAVVNTAKAAGSATYGAVKTVAGASDTIANTVRGIGNKLLGSSADDVAEAAITTVAKEGSDDALSVWMNALSEVGDDAVSTIAKNYSDDAAAAVANTATTKTGFLSTITNALGSAVKTVTNALASAGKTVAGGKLSQWVDDIVALCQSSKIYQVLTEKVMPKLAGGAKNLSKALKVANNLLVPLSALNAGSRGGTARLFKVNQDAVTPLMQVISGAIGALEGTTPGAVIELINEVIYDCIGVDIIAELALMVYNFFAGEENYEAVVSAQEAFKVEYNQTVEDAIAAQKDTYNAMHGTNLSDEEFAHEVEEGNIEVAYQSLADYNTEKNQNLSSKIYNKALKPLGKAIGSVGSKIFGSKSEYYMDSAGNKYVENEDGTYQVYGPNGEDYGYVAADEAAKYVDLKNGKITDKTEGLVGKGISAVKSGVGGAISTVTGAASSAASWVGDKATALGTTVSNFASSVGGTVSGMIDFAKEAASGLSQGIETIKSNYMDTSVDFATYFNSDVNPVSEENPLHDIVGGALGAGKVLMWPILTITGIGKKIAEGFKKFISGVATVVKSFAQTDAQIAKYIYSGDVDGYSNWKVDVGENVPLSGIVNTVLGIRKVMNTPLVWISHAGHKIAEGISNFIGGVVDVATAVNEVSEQANEYIKSGDIEGYSNFVPDVGEDVPLSGFINGVLRISKTLDTPLVWISHAGHKIAEGVSSVISTIKETGDTITTSGSELFALAMDGDASGVSSYEATVNEDSPLAGIAKAVVGVQKFFATPVAYVKSAFNSVANTIKNAFTSAGDIIADVKAYATEMVSYTDTSKDISGLKQLKMNGVDTDPVRSVISSLISGVLTTYVNIMRAVKSIPDFLGNVAGGAVSFVTNTASNIGNAVGNLVNNAGTALMDSARGGKGDTENGYPYYSQNDARWGNVTYDTSGKETMSDAGCGPTALAMAASKITGKDISPLQVAADAKSGGYRDESGTNWNFMEPTAAKYGMSTERVEYPNSNYIRDELSHGRSVIMSGTGDGATTPYTSGGHYVVAVGTSGNDVIVNDPRSKSKSGRYDLDSVVSRTGAAWSLSKGGKGVSTKTRRPNMTLVRGGGFTLGDTNDSSKLAEARNLVVNTMKSLEGKLVYSQGTNRTQVIQGVAGDCSSTCQQVYIHAIGIDPGSYTGAQIKSSNGSDVDNTSGCPSENNLLPGDLLFFSNGKGSVGHVEMYIGNGKLMGHGGPGKGPTTKDMATYCQSRAQNGKGYMKARRWILASNAEHITLNSAAASSTGNSSSSSSSSGTSIFDKVANFFTSFASKAWEGITTGNWNTDYSSVWNALSSASTDSTSGVSADSSITGSDNAEKIWNYFKGKGWSDYAIAGIMGNMQQESGLNPMNLQNSYETSLGYTDQSYTDAVDNGSYPYSKFTGDKAGYGLVQWTYSGLKKKLYNDAKANSGKSIGSLDVQLPSLLDTLGTDYGSVVSSMNQASSVKDASDTFMLKFERPADQSDSAKNKRASYGQKYYELYGGKGGEGEGDGFDMGTTNFFNSGDLQALSTEEGITDAIMGDGGFGPSKRLTTNTDVYRKPKQAQGGFGSQDVNALLSQVVSLLSTISQYEASSNGKLDLLNQLSGIGTSITAITENNNKAPVVINSGGSNVTGTASKNEELAKKIASGTT